VGGAGSNRVLTGSGPDVAGVIEAGRFSPTEEGTAQGAVISPLLLNIALHGMEEAAAGRYQRCDLLGSRPERTHRSSCDTSRSRHRLIGAALRTQVPSGPGQPVQVDGRRQRGNPRPRCGVPLTGRRTAPSCITLAQQRAQELQASTVAAAFLDRIHRFLPRKHFDTVGDTRPDPLRPALPGLINEDL
jgi:hypothetical protein